MPRSLRIERVNGTYLVINRENYRSDIFVDAGGHKAFEHCLFEACLRVPMGAPQSVSGRTSRLKRATEQQRDPAFAEFYQNIPKCPLS